MGERRTTPARRVKALTNRHRVEALIADLEREGPWDSRQAALGQLALTLADSLDVGMGLATAGVSKELRATIAEMVAGRGGDDDDDGWVAGMSAPLRDAKEP